MFPLAQLTRIVILIQVVEKSCSMCTPNSIIVIILMASLFWKIPRLTLNFWWYSFICYAKRAVEYWKTGIIIFRLKKSIGFASFFECEIRNRKKQFRPKIKKWICLSSNCTIPALYKSWIGWIEWFDLIRDLGQELKPWVWFVCLIITPWLEQHVSLYLPHFVQTNTNLFKPAQAKL